eukprot:365693-Chlamydomonas_euryale.AAC.29
MVWTWPNTTGSASITTCTCCDRGGGLRLCMWGRVGAGGNHSIGVGEGKITDCVHEWTAYGMPTSRRPTTEGRPEDADVSSMQAARGCSRAACKKVGDQQ